MGSCKSEVDARYLGRPDKEHHWRKSAVTSALSCRWWIWTVVKCHLGRYFFFFFFFLQLEGTFSKKCLHFFALCNRWSSFFTHEPAGRHKDKVCDSVWTMYHQMARCRNGAPWSSCPLAWNKWTQRPSPTWLGQLLGSDGSERKCSWEQNSLWWCGDVPWKSFCSCVACMLHLESEVKAGSWQELRSASPLWWERERKRTFTSESLPTAPQMENVSVN